MTNQTKKNNQVATTVNEKSLFNMATNYINTQKIKLPANYDISGAVSGFYLRLLETTDKNKIPALQVCTKSSIEKALRDMIANGLDPRKKQVYPIVYGNSLSLQESYFGNQKKARTYDLRLSDFHAQVIFKADKYKTRIEPDGRKTLVQHEQQFGSRNLEDIIGAYSIVLIDGIPDLEDMTIDEIKQSWAKSRSNGAVHKEFPVEMCKKTVLNRHAKRFINSSNDSAIIENNQNLGNEKEKPIDIDDDNVIEMDTPDIQDFTNEPNCSNEPIEPADSFDDDAPDFMKDDKAEMGESVCADCGKEINSKAYDYSVKWYKRPLCFDCQQLEKAKQ